MTDPATLSLSFPAIRSKKVTGAFDGGAITSDAGVLLLAQAERRMGIVDRLAVLIPDDRNLARVVHGLADILRARVLAIAAGYEDANDLDALRHDPAFMMALGKAPGEAVGLASQPTMSPLLSYGCGASCARLEPLPGTSFMTGSGGGRTVPLLVIADRCRVWSPPSFSFDLNGYSGFGPA